MEIASQIADALNFLHVVNEPKSLIHGDVKSSNILLDKHLTPKLSDFGLARECVNRPNHTSLSTNSRVAMGTVAYMAPEFLRNSKPSSKTDVYAFGVVMLELFTGQAPDDPSRDIRTLVSSLANLYIIDINEIFLEL
jgi:interleukin-1 receptor-associated kinase 1